MAFPFDDEVDNPYLDWLEGRTPEAFLYERLGTRPSVGAQQVVQGLAPLLLNQFQGQIARQAQAGELPDERFRNFIRQMNIRSMVKRHTPGTRLTSPLRMLT
jgi:hypothetical protein